MRQDFQLVTWVLILPILKYWRLGTWCQKAAFVHVIHIICLRNFWCIIRASVPKEDRTTGVSPGDFVGYTIWWIDAFEWNIRIIYSDRIAWWVLNTMMLFIILQIVGDIIYWGTGMSVKRSGCWSGQKGVKRWCGSSYIMEKQEVELLTWDHACLGDWLSSSFYKLLWTYRRGCQLHREFWPSN